MSQAPHVKGYGEEDYREAIEKRESMNGAAKELGVTRPTVREMCVRYNIFVPSINKVPDPLPSKVHKLNRGGNGEEE